jgi:hypothetical protein
MRYSRYNRPGISAYVTLQGTIWWAILSPE